MQKIEAANQCNGNATRKTSEFPQVPLLTRSERICEAQAVARINRNDLRYDQHTYSHNFIECFLDSPVNDNSKKISYLKEKLKGKIVVDLGCGGVGSVHDNISIMARLGVKNYIGIDVDLNALHANLILIEGLEMPLVRYIKEDMLVFASKLKDKSVNFFMCGIDNTIIKSDVYWERLGEQLARATEDNGLIFGRCKPLFATADHFNMIHSEPWWEGEAFILEKK